MSFRRQIGLTLNAVTKLRNKQPIQISSKKNTSPTIKVKKNKPVLKNKYSVLWRFHHGDEL